MGAETVKALIGIGFAVTALAVLVTLGLLWKRRSFDFRFRKGTLVGVYTALGLFWLLVAGLGAAGQDAWFRVAFHAFLGLVWLGGAALVWKYPEHFRLRES